jgi:hypothetical protein
LHLHANGRHLLEAVASLRGLKALCLLDDIGFASSFEVLPHVRQRVGDLPLVVFVDYAPFQEALEQHSLAGGVFYRVRNVPDAATANCCMDQVRSYRT